MHNVGHPVFYPKGDLALDNTPQRPYTDDYTNYLLCLALDVGEYMLRCGGEVGRVEDTIERICKAYGAEHVEVFSVISFINAGIRMPDGSYSSQLRRVKSTANNLFMLEALNALSREICSMTPDLAEFDAKIEAVKKKKAYPLPVLMGASALSVGAFTVFFGGNWRDAIVAMLIGALLSAIENLPTRRLNAMAKMVFSSFVAASLALLSVRLGLGSNQDAIIIGSIMLLVPGLAFGTALRDLLCGDLLAGSLKTVQAILAALMIAFGYMLATLITGAV